MARIVDIRPSYSADTQFFFRLAEAIEHDDKQPADWKRRTIIKIMELIQLLCEANERKFKKNEKERTR